MSIPLCEVIGCHRTGSWRAVREGNGLLEEYLCETCYQILDSWYPERAACYAPRNVVSAEEVPNRESANRETEIASVDSFSNLCVHRHLPS
jgi:hypothetical protein